MIRIQLKLEMPKRGIFCVQAKLLIKRLLTVVGDYSRMAGLIFGGVPKRSTGADCKSVGSAFVGSNPTPSTRTNLFCWSLLWVLVLGIYDGFGKLKNKGCWGDSLDKDLGWIGYFNQILIVNVRYKLGGCSSMVEPQPSKLMTWVRLPSPAPSKAY